MTQKFDNSVSAKASKIEQKNQLDIEVAELESQNKKMRKQKDMLQKMFNELDEKKREKDIDRGNFKA